VIFESEKVTLLRAGEDGHLARGGGMWYVDRKVWDRTAPGLVVTLYHIPSIGAGLPIDVFLESVGAFADFWIHPPTVASQHYWNNKKSLGEKNKILTFPRNSDPMT
jgi:hypothetical protein